jgi:hypothetical protein
VAGITRTKTKEKVVQELTAAMCKGDCIEELVAFSQLMARLWQQHRTSPTNAGEENFYAWGNLDYTVVIAMGGFDDLVEIKSRFGDLDIKKDADGLVSCAINPSEKAKLGDNTITEKEILRLTMLGLQHYYDTQRDW